MEPVGQVEVDPRLWRATWNNQLVEDLSGAVISGSVTHDTSRANHWSLDCTMHYDGWVALRPFVDWVAPVMNLRYPDGTVVSRQLGHFLVLDSPEHREELGGTVRLDARDVLWAVNAQGIQTAIMMSGMQFGLLAKNTLLDATVPGGLATSKFRQTIPNFNVPPRPDTFRGFPVNTRRLAVINELFATGAHYPLYPNQLGVLSTHPMTPLYDHAPLRSWYANPPAGNHFIGEDLVNLTPFVGQPSPVIGAVDTTPSSAELVDEIIVIGGAGGSRVRGSAKTARFTGGSGPGPGTKKGSAKTVTIPLVPDDGAAEEIALRILEEMLTENSTISLTVKPDPTFVAIHAPVRLGIWDLLGRKVAVGKYLVKRVRYGMTVEDPLMRVDLGALAGAIPL